MAWRKTTSVALVAEFECVLVVVVVIILNLERLVLVEVRAERELVRLGGRARRPSGASLRSRSGRIAKVKVRVDRSCLLGLRDESLGQIGCSVSLVTRRFTRKRTGLALDAAAFFFGAMGSSSESTSIALALPFALACERPDHQVSSQTGSQYGHRLGTHGTASLAARRMRRRFLGRQSIQIVKVVLVIADGDLLFPGEFTSIPMRHFDLAKQYSSPWQQLRPSSALLLLSSPAAASACRPPHHY